ncbi:MAG: hypothetical protein HYU26_15765 [Candidatus Rokubacteria bacterium]|nr:hypothetical protein [Candidatus Rokubacteria bacterium]MBI2158338.1 hypothetical protein [Candidatus Rokubacteria bacterium]
MRRALAAALAGALLAGCATADAPPPAPIASGALTSEERQRESDAVECRRLAREQAGGGEPRDTGRSVGAGIMLGLLLGPAAALFMAGATGGAVAAYTGAAAGGVAAGFESEAAKTAYEDAYARCLRDRGHTLPH